MTEASSQTDDGADLKNPDIIRIQGFTKSLMQRILKLNIALTKLARKHQAIKALNAKAPFFGSEEQGVSVDSSRKFSELRA